MTTSNDAVPNRHRRPERSPRDAIASRVRILESAKVLFSEGTYEGVGVRDIAAAAHLDPSLIIRYFGSKEQLFREIAEKAFGTQEFLKSGTDGLALNAADVLMAEFDECAWRRGYDPLRFLLASIGSPVAGPILADYLNRDFLQPLAGAMHGPAKMERSIMLAAQIVGFALMRIVCATQQEGKQPADRALRRLFVAYADGIISDTQPYAKRSDG